MSNETKKGNLDQCARMFSMAFITSNIVLSLLSEIQHHHSNMDTTTISTFTVYSRAKKEMLSFRSHVVDLHIAYLSVLLLLVGTHK